MSLMDKMSIEDLCNQYWYYWNHGNRSKADQILLYVKNRFGKKF
jgi:hypothetical protein